jgi:hypothetical protein
VEAIKQMQTSEAAAPETLQAKMDKKIASQAHEIAQLRAQLAQALDGRKPLTQAALIKTE